MDTNVFADVPTSSGEQHRARPQVYLPASHRHDSRVRSIVHTCVIPSLPHCPYGSGSCPLTLSFRLILSHLTPHTPISPDFPLRPLFSLLFLLVTILVLAFPSALPLRSPSVIVPGSPLDAAREIVCLSRFFLLSHLPLPEYMISQVSEDPQSCHSYSIRTPFCALISNPQNTYTIGFRDPTDVAPTSKHGPDQQRVC